MVIFLCLLNDGHRVCSLWRSQGNTPSLGNAQNNCWFPPQWSLLIPHMHSFECPESPGFCFRQLLGKDALLCVRYAGPGGMSQGVGRHAWKTNPRVKDKGRLEEETYIWNLCTHQPGVGPKDQKARELLGTGPTRDKMSACGYSLSVTHRPHNKM